MFSLSFDITERREAEKTLRHSEAFFRAAFCGSAVASLLVGADGIVIQANGAMCKMLGYDVGDLTGLSILAFTHPEHRARTDRAREDLIAGRLGSIEMEKQYVHRDGRLIDVMVMVALVRDPESETYFTTHVFDLTEQKRTEQAVLARERHLAEIVNVQQEVATVSLEKTDIIHLIAERARSLTAADGASVAMLEHGRLIYRSIAGEGAAKRVRGLGRDSSLTGRCMLERKVLRCDDATTDDRVNQPLAASLAVRSLICAPVLHDDVAVGALTVFATGAHAFDASDDHSVQLMAGLAGAALAHAAAFAAKHALIVERTEALALLGEREALIRSLIENAADPLITLDEKGLISYSSPSLERLLGRPANDFIGVHPTELCHADDQSLLADTLTRIVTTQRNVAVEARLAHRDGTWKTLRVTGRNLLDDPAIRGIIVNLHDMTDEVVVSARLRQSQKLAAVGQLAGGVAHDFNNLLTVISGYSEFLAQSFDERDPRGEDVREIRAAADRAAGLTRQLLAFSRRQILQPKVVDVNEIVTGLQAMLQRLIGEDLSLVTHLATEPAMVVADPGQLEQVVVNLVINARDAMPNGGTLTLEVQLTELDTEYPVNHPGVVPGPYVMLAVTDTGVGMTREVREQIFDPFFTTKDAGKGTGLGLSTVYGIVKQSNGYIWAYSEPGLWSTFKVYLPLSAAHSIPTLTDAATVASTRAETVLLVEDETAVREISRRILVGLGYCVLEARDGLHALEVAQAFSDTIHLLVTDVVMPRMSGRALADQLSERRPGLAVLYLSGYTNDEILRRNLAEADDRLRLLQKPFTSHGLAAAVREALDARD